MSNCMNFEERIVGEVSIVKVRKNNKEGFPYVLEAKLSINNPDGHDIEFVWIKDHSFPDRIRKNNPIYYLSRNLLGHEITCKVRCAGMSGWIISPSYLITEQDFPREYNHAAPSRIVSGDPLEGPPLAGSISISKNYVANIYNAKYNDGVVLEAAINLGVEVDPADINYTWGYVYTTGNRAGLLNEMEPLEESKAFFWCRHKDAIGRIYRCVIRCNGYSGVIVGEYGPITEDDFKIPLVGRASIVPEVCTKKGHYNEIVMKASFYHNNINSKPTYTWFVGDRCISTGTDSRLNISKSDTSKPIKCEITHSTREGSIGSEPYVLSLEEYSLLSEQLKSDHRQSTSPVAENPATSLLSMLKKFKSSKGEDYCGQIFYQNGCAQDILLRVPNYRGCRYEGVIVYGEPSGYGKLTTDDGYEYEGIWERGKLTGQGVVRSSSGVSYEGGWKDSCADGHGKLIYPNGEIYEGPFHCGKKGTGEGRIVFANGDVYVGRFCQGRITGHGKLMLANGGVYEHGILRYLNSQDTYTICHVNVKTA